MPFYRKTPLEQLDEDLEEGFKQLREAVDNANHAFRTGEISRAQWKERLTELGFDERNIEAEEKYLDEKSC